MKKILILCCTAVMLLGGCRKQEQTPQPKPKKEHPIRSVSLSFTGDILIEDALYNWMGKGYDFKNYFDKVTPYLKADLVIGNQEVVLGGETLGITGSDYTFNAPEEIAKQLPEIGFDVLTFANNHSYDRGMQEIVNTRKNLKAAGIQTTGAYEKKEQRDDILVVERNGIRFAILAYTYDTNQWIDAENSFAINHFLNEEHMFDDRCKKQLARDVQKAKEQADVVIAAMHWGTEFTYEIDAAQRDAAGFLNEQGVDIIIGNHPHCLQRVETLTNAQGKETFVMYSLGNFVSAAMGVDRASEQFTNMYEIGGIVQCDVELNTKTGETTVKNKKMIPIVNHFDASYDGFRLLPFSSYTEELAAAHGQRTVSSDFTYAWLREQLKQLYDGEIAWQ
ncbi:CapA family protein [[Clostridium] innocuum]|uniref:CapA family protein n=1 Tax=Clostridium innocuum TaxID=1522 RepID=UPI001C244073|nr:CapA family protein [[Clostridium] innocuum]MBU9113384.1 CapA family protein [[Clostridium] innocuum]